jgi:hypothetical protein
MTKLLPAMLGLFLVSGNVLATPTDITVRVIAKDAKFIGSGMDGARVVLQDANSGEVLAEGIAQGNTGDTKKIMRAPRIRGQALSTEGSGSYTTTLDLAQPTKIQVVVEGPLSNPDSANRVTATQWVVPGKHLTGGDGWLLEMPGFSVTAQALVSASRADDSAVLTMTATVTMMCGCPIEPGGLWDANGYEVAAILTDSAGNSTTIPMSYAGKTSVFSGSAPLTGSGPFEAAVYAYDSSNGNTGVDIARFNGP